MISLFYDSVPDVLVVGGGVLGLMTARELARAGARVTLLERGATGAEASWAGGGIVSPLYPWRYSPAVTALATSAQGAYPDLARSLLEETGIDPEYFRCGMLMLDAEDADEARIWAGRQQLEMEVWSDAELQRYQGLASHWRAGLWMPGIANIRNPRLLKALHVALLRQGVAIHEQCEVVRWEHDGERVTSAVSRDGRRFAAGQYVVCGGAWSGELLKPLLPALALRPVRGQMLLYRLTAGGPPGIVLAEGRYVIPRRDGHVLCGSTLEESGFDKSVTEVGRLSLMASAARLWPALGQLQPVAHWAGLRPAAPQGRPYIGRVPSYANLWINAGQFRNGLVLAPASAQLLADLLLGREPVVDPRPYQVL